MRLLNKTVCALLALPAMATFCAAQQAPLRLTLDDAIQRGIKANLSGVIAGTRVAEAGGTTERRLSALLPHARAEFDPRLQAQSLRAQGITVPQLPPVVGPFATYDFRVYADQSLIDLQSYHLWKSSQREQDAAREDYQSVRDDLVRLIAGYYLNAEYAAARVEAAKQRVKTSEALYRLAMDQHSAGLATAVDELRAQVQMTTDQQNLVVVQNAQKLALIDLARNIGLTPGTPLELADTLDFRAAAPLDVDSEIGASLARRADYQSLARQRDALLEQQKANHSRNLPRLTLAGNFGGIGRTFGSVDRTGAIGASLSFTLFDRDRGGESKQLASQLARLDAQMADMRLGIEQDIREAALTLDSAAQETTIANSALELAERELTLAQDRFRSGVTDNIEVVQAQDSVSRALENRILALSRHADAKAALARAL
ncbi:MAG: TolC family protein, partial [Bryobacteraceae bacterium]